MHGPPFRISYRSDRDGPFLTSEEHGPFKPDSHAPSAPRSTPGRLSSLRSSIAVSTLPGEVRYLVIPARYLDGSLGHFRVSLAHLFPHEREPAMLGIGPSW